MVTRPMEVVIIGGSISGLMHGIMIKRLGHNVRILEQNPTSVRIDQGAGMGTGPLGHTFFQDYDQFVRPLAFDCPGFSILDNDDSTKRFIASPMHLTSWNILYYRLRSLFDGFESSFQPSRPEVLADDGAAIFDLSERVTDVSEHDGLLTVTFEHVGVAGGGEIHADLVIDASGPCSLIRKKFLPKLKAGYCGFLAWRGTVSESEVSEKTRQLFDCRFNSFSMSNSYIVGYAVPGKDDDMSSGNRYLNFVWYCNVPEGSTTIIRALTDMDGNFHHNSVPAGKLDPKVWAQQCAHGETMLDPAYLELVKATRQPFVSTIRESYSPRLAFLSNKLLLVGDGSNLMRPTAGMSMNNAAIQCLLMKKVFKGEITIEQWQQQCLATGWSLVLFSRLVSDFYLAGKFRFLLTALTTGIYTIWQRFSALWRRPVKL